MFENVMFINLRNINFRIKRSTYQVKIRGFDYVTGRHEVPHKILLKRLPPIEPSSFNVIQTYIVMSSWNFKQKFTINKIYRN